MTQHRGYDLYADVVDQVARRLQHDGELKKRGVKVSIAQGERIDRVVLETANGPMELVATPDGVALGRLKEWPVHDGDEAHVAAAVDYLTALMRRVAAGEPFERRSVQSFET